MNRFGTFFTLVCFVLGLMLAPTSFHVTHAQDAAVPITPDNAAGVIQLARFGRGELQGATWSPDGAQLLVYSAAGLWVYDAADLSAPPALLPGTAATIRSAMFNADGSLIAAGDGGGTVHVWDTATQEETLTLALEGNFSTTRAAFSPDSSQIIMSVGDNLLLHDVATGDLLVELKDAHNNIITGLAYSPDGSLILSHSSDKTARLWNAATLTEVAMMEGHTSYVNRAAFSPDGSLIVTVSSDKTTRLWDGTTGAEVAIYEQERGNVYGADFDPTGTQIVTGSSYGTIRFFDAAALDEPEVWEESHTGDVYTVAISPDGTRLASVGEDQAVKLWDLATGEELDSAPGHTQSIGNLALNADETLILAGSYDSTLRVWDITGDDARPVITLEEALSTSTANLDSAAFNPDGTQFASIRASTLRAWDTASQELLYEVGDYSLGSFRSMTYSPDGSLIATTTQKGYVMLWNAQTGDQLALLTGHSERTTPVMFNADNSLVISGGLDGTVRLWGLPATAGALGIGSGEVSASLPDSTDGDAANSDSGDSGDSLLDTPVQPGPGTFVAEDGFTFQYPPDWVLREETPTAVTLVPDESVFATSALEFVAGQDVKIQVEWGPFETMVKYGDLDPSTATAADIANVLFSVYYPMVFEVSDPIESNWDNTIVARMDGTNRDLHHLLLVFTLDNDTVTDVRATFLGEDLAQFEPVVFDMVSSLVGAAPPEADAATSAAEPEPPAEAPAILLPPPVDDLPALIGPDDCQNVVVGVLDYSSQYSDGYAPGYLIDGDPATGWSSAGYQENEYIVFKLDGKQTVGGVLFNSYSTSAGYELDSIKDFRIDVPDGTAGIPVFTGQAALTEGFQAYTFPPVTADKLRLTFTSTHGGDYFEAAEIMICAASGDAPPVSDDALRQWASNATASSQYTDTDWSAAQATGAPDTPECGDIATAWASAAPDGVDTLTVYFDTPVVPQQVNIYQTYAPGSITGITLVKNKGGEFPVPNSADSGMACPGVFSLTIPPDLTMGSTVDGVRIELDQRKLGNWNEIDAVELVGVPE